MINQINLTSIHIIFGFKNCIIQMTNQVVIIHIAYDLKKASIKK